MTIWVSADLLFSSLVMSKFAVELREIASAHECTLSFAAMREIGREVRIGKLSLGRLSCPLVTDTAWYFEE
jgi:hypothetical protein